MRYRCKTVHSSEDTILVLCYFPGYSGPLMEKKGNEKKKKVSSGTWQAIKHEL